MDKWIENKHIKITKPCILVNFFGSDYNSLNADGKCAPVMESLTKCTEMCYEIRKYAACIWALHVVNGG